jgi:type IV secretion system protein VirB3
MEDRPEGFEIPVHRSLTRPILMGGVPRRSAIVLLTVGGAFVQGLGISSIIVVGPVVFVLYLGLVSAVKNDPEIQDTFIQHWHQADELEV